MIYLDNAATTKPSAKAIEALTNAMENSFANPSSIHNLGLNSSIEMTKAKEILLTTLVAKGKGEIYFTSGGTESNNLAILGALGHKKHIVTTKAEHSSVLKVIEAQKSRGYTVSYVPLDPQGIATPQALAPLVTKDTALVAIMDTNNETGAVNDINALGKVVKENSRAIFHVDAVASFTKKKIDMTYVDTLSISSHKVHGPGGIGALFVRKGVNIKPLFFGGNAHNKVRPGTENVAMAMAFATAAKAAYNDMDTNTAHVQGLRDTLVQGLAGVDYIKFNTPYTYLPYLVNLSVIGAKGQVVVNALSARDVYVSTGAACNERSFNVLQNLGHGKDVSDGAVRVSFSANNNIDDVKGFCKALVSVVGELGQL